MREKYGILDPSELKSALAAKFDQYSGYEQQDAHEFLLHLLDILDDEMIAALRVVIESRVAEEGSSNDMALKRQRLDRSPLLSTEEHSFSTNASDAPSYCDRSLLDEKIVNFLPTYRQFNSEVTVTLSCMSCQFTHCKRERFTNFSLNLPSSGMNAGNVEGLLQSFFKTSVVDLKCDKCKTGSQSQVINF